MSLAGAFVVVTLLSIGPLIDLDRVLNVPFHERWPQLRPVMAVLAGTGERGVLLPPLFAFAAYLAWRRRTWTPVLIPVVPTLVLNLLVGVCKLVTARGRPMAGDPDFFEQGILYPSGHAANVILYLGLAVVLARRYGDPASRLPKVLLTLTWLGCVLMVVACMYRQVHWFTDMVAGLLAGGAVLRSTVYERGVVRRLSAWAGAVVRRLAGRWGRRTARTGRRPELPDEATARLNGRSARERPLVPDGAHNGAPQVEQRAASRDASDRTSL